jgi:hypothetical protein
VKLIVRGWTPCREATSAIIVRMLNPAWLRHNEIAAAPMTRIAISQIMGARA